MRVGKDRFGTLVSKVIVHVPSATTISGSFNRVDTNSWWGGKLKDERDPASCKKTCCLACREGSEK